MLGSLAQLVLVPWYQGHEFVMLLYLVLASVATCLVTGAFGCCTEYTHIKSNHFNQASAFPPCVEDCYCFELPLKICPVLSGQLR